MRFSKVLLLPKGHGVVRRFLRTEDGVTAIEFGIVAAPFFALMFAIFETAFVFFGQQTLDTAVGNAAREIRTGQAQQQGFSQADFQNEICKQVNAFFNCATGVALDVRTYPTFDSINLTNPVDAGGNFDSSKFIYSPGHGGDIVVVRAFYQWPMITGLVGLANMSNGTHLMASAAAFRNEPFPLVTQMLRAMLPFKSFVRNQQAVSAIEFALILPIMVTLYLGGVEVGDALTINRKVTNVTSSLADLITQSKTISNTDMTNIMNAAASIVAPYKSASLKIKITQVKIDSAGKATVDWSDAQNDTPLTHGAAISIPTAVKTPGTYIVTAEVHFPYTPSIGYVMTGSYDLHDNFYLRPRLVNCIKRPGSTSAC